MTTRATTRYRSRTEGTTSDLLMTHDIERVWTEFTAATEDASVCTRCASDALAMVTAEMGLAPGPADTPEQRMLWNLLIMAQAAHAVASIRLGTATAEMVRMVANERNAADVVAFAASRATIH